VCSNAYWTECALWRRIAVQPCRRCTCTGRSVRCTGGLRRMAVCRRADTVQAVYNFLAEASIREITIMESAWCRLLSAICYRTYAILSCLKRIRGISQSQRFAILVATRRSTPHVTPCRHPAEWFQTTGWLQLRKQVLQSLEPSITESTTHVHAPAQGTCASRSLVARRPSDAY
jgi:hypothetical protein